MKIFHSNIFIIAAFPFSHARALPFSMQIYYISLCSLSVLLRDFFLSPHLFWALSSSRTSSLLSLSLSLSSPSSSSWTLTSRTQIQDPTNAHTQYLFITCLPKKGKKKTFFPLVLLLNIMRFSYLNIIRSFAKWFLCRSVGVVFPAAWLLVLHGLDPLPPFLSLSLAIFSPYDFNQNRLRDRESHDENELRIYYMYDSEMERIFNEDPHTVS